MTISAERVKELREKTGAGIMECKKALSDAAGDMEKAIRLLREGGVAVAAKKADRVAREGVIGSYIHGGGKIGVLIEVNCETDFVARNSEFQEMVKELAMQVAWSNPTYLCREEIPEEVLNQEREIYRVQAKQSGKPETVVEKIAEGKMEKFFQGVCFLEQPFIKDPSTSIGELVKEKISKIKENIVIRRFVRYQLGETGQG
jgi:elongation factor Ts